MKCDECHRDFPFTLEWIIVKGKVFCVCPDCWLISYQPKAPKEDYQK